MRALFIMIIPVLLCGGCSVKEGAEFYALQHQDNQLANCVSNLQVQVNELMVENHHLRNEVNTNSAAVNFLIQDDRQEQIKFANLQNQIHKILETTKQ